MRVLITGAFGFVGRQLCERFANDGHWVIGVDRPPSLPSHRPPPATGIHWCERDLVHPIDSLVPLDAVVVCSPAWGLAQAGLTANERHCLARIATLQAIRLARQHDARLMLISSSARTDAEREAEAHVIAANRVHQQDIRIARLFNPYGPGMSFDATHPLAALLRQIASKDARMVSCESRSDTYCYIDDVIEGLVRLLYGGDHRPFDIGSPRIVTPKQLQRIWQHVIQSTWPSPIVGDTCIMMTPQNSRQQRTGLKPKLARTRLRLGWTPQWSLHDGLAATVAALAHQQR